MTRLTTMITMAAALALLAMPAAAASVSPALYHSPGSTGADPGTPPSFMAGGGIETMYLFLDAGAVPTETGIVCDNGNGDDTCGLHFKICLTGDLTFVGSFAADVGVVQQSSTVAVPCVPGEPSVLGTELNVAILTTASPLAVVPTRLGTIDVDTSGPNGGDGELTMLQTVDADLELTNGTTRPLFIVPEPGFLLQLVPGAALLWFLSRRTNRRE
jgi:hypothetical protein